MTITGIVARPRAEGRFDLLVDGAARGVVSVDVIERFGLRVGAALDTARLPELEEAIATLATYDRALRMLAAQPRSERDLRRRLARTGEPESRLSVVLARLIGAGLVDDEAFARQFTRSRVLGRGASRRRVETELFARGVRGPAATEAIADVFDEEAVDEDALVEQAARKKARSLGTLEPAVRRRRLYAFLARRGYDADRIRRAMALVLGTGALDGGDEPEDRAADD